ncbi:MAG TPA: hypothetical protein VK327_06985, partial [Candidatus Paceibacterota bacterium]|nr:hypothetical protein [Candidatus Paceibacterota bacterium]
MRSTKPALKSGNLVSAVSMAVLAGSLLIALTPHSAALSPYAVEVISAQGPFGPTVYGDTNSVLGAPATRYYDPSGGSRRVKLVEPAFNVASDTNGLITPNLVLTFNAGSQLIVRFDHPVSNNPANPYGIDLLVFGNTLYGAGFVNDATDMNTRSLGGSSSGSADDAVAISVSPGYTSLPGEDANDPSTWPWYRYAFGPYGDTGFPTQAFKWNRTAASWTDEVM